MLSGLKDTSCCWFVMYSRQDSNNLLSFSLSVSVVKYLQIFTLFFSFHCCRCDEI